MTRAELVEMLEESFAADEEVTFSYPVDDGDDWTTDCFVRTEHFNAVIPLETMAKDKAFSYTRKRVEKKVVRITAR